MRSVLTQMLMSLLVLMLCSGRAQAAATASLNRDRVAMGDAVVLSITSDEDTTPDFSPLTSDFELQGRSASSQTSIVNGHVSSQHVWTTEIAPRRSGALQVPSIVVGSSRTDPIALSVSEQPLATAGDGSMVFLENTLETTSPYVQQSAIYTLRLYYGVTLLDGALDAPAVDGVNLSQLGDDSKGSTVINGRRFDVIERRYVLTPERSGAIEVPAPTFRGRAMGGGFDGMFAGGAVGARGKAISLTVRPRPAQAGDRWLPAQAVTLAAQPQPGPLHAGEPLTLNVTVTALGATGAQIPDPTLPQIPGAQVYPQASTTQDSAPNGHLRGQRMRRFAIVPNAQGTLQIPPITQDWWNVNTDQPAQARTLVPALSVLPGAALQSPAGDDSSGANALPVGAPDHASGNAGATDSAQLWSIENIRLWRGVALVLIFALALTAWWGWRRGQGRIARKSPRESGSAAHVRKRNGPTLDRALKMGELDAIARALLDAAQGDHPRHLADVAQQLHDSAQASAVQSLDAARWGRGDHAAALASLRAAFAKPPDWRSHRAAKSVNDGLPPLYPPG
ncbi:MAG: BatD family protein [Lysobacteraceae bacterium]